MTFDILVTEAAESDLGEHHDYIAVDSDLRSKNWLREAWEKIFSLSEMPTRFAVIEESDDLGLELRQILHCSHRIIFSVDEEHGKVTVLRVWHSARRTPGLEEIR